MKYIYLNHKFLTALGLRHITYTKGSVCHAHLVATWGSIGTGPAFGFNVENFSDDADSGYFAISVGLILLAIRLRIPFFSRKPKDPMLDVWGFDFGQFGVVLSCDPWTRTFSYPWERVCISREIRCKDGSWMDARGIDTSEILKDDPFNPVHIEKHTCCYGGISPNQRLSEATVVQYRRIWRPLLTQRLPIFQSRRTSIDVHFDPPIGEDINSWKGGTVSTTEPMKSGELIKDTLDRMLRYRKF